jgi:hypothetical protein
VYARASLCVGICVHAYLYIYSSDMREINKVWECTS